MNPQIQKNPTNPNQNNNQEDRARSIINYLQRKEKNYLSKQRICSKNKDGNDTRSYSAEDDRKTSQERQSVSLRVCTQRSILQNWRQSQNLSEILLFLLLFLHSSSVLKGLLRKSGSVLETGLHERKELRSSINLGTYDRLVGYI